MQSNKLLKLVIVTPVEELYKGKIIKVTIPGTKAPFQVLYNHAPIISTIERGNIIFIDENNKYFNFYIMSGIVEVLNNKITILSEEIKKV